jgi:alpha-L-rhamnosidase
MKRINLLLFLFFCLQIGAKNIEVVNPKVEMRTNPIGIGSRTPLFSWEINTEKENVMQISYRLLVASTPEKLKVGKADMWDSELITSDKSNYIAYRGKALQSGERYYWKVMVKTNKGKKESRPAYFQMALINHSEWIAKWIGGDFKSDQPKDHSKINARYLRKEFKVDGKVAKATLYICGLGLYEAYINGEKIGDQVLAPAATTYDKSIRYNTFDVTNLLNSGENAIGVILGNGRFAPFRLPGSRNFGTSPCLLAQLEITTDKGVKQRIISDKSWKMMADGPIQWNNEYDGELQDATKAMPGWNKVGYNAASWVQAQQLKKLKGYLMAQVNPNIKVMDTVKPISIHKTPDGRYILDMGQNMVGWLRVNLHGNEGDTLKMHFAERLNGEDSIYVANLRSAETTDTYVSNHAAGIWEPSFTYHGFRYVELKGFKTAPSLADIQGQVVYDEMATTGQFSTSNDLINKIYHCAFWGIRGNYRSFPTDCPQRNERMGWLGDRATGSLGECYIFDNHLFYNKWEQDIREAQREDSVVNDVAPRYWSVYSDNVTWPMAWYNVADMLYRQFGDVRAIIENYEGMKRFMLHQKNKFMKDGIITHDTYGDWCMPPESPELIHSKDPSRITNGNLLSTSAYYQLCLKMAKFAKLSGNEKDIAFWQDLAKEVRKSFNATFYNTEKGYYDNNTVTANILALRWGLAEEQNKEKIFANVIDQMVNKFNTHIGTGVLGTQEIMRGLTDYGRSDIAFKMVTNTSFPSWGFMVEHGATTIWELWNGDTANPAMNSGNHVMLLGDLVIWFYNYLAGIGQQPESIGFKKIELRPRVIEGLDHVEGSYHSIYGDIKSSWSHQNGQFSWSISIPANTTAKVYVPVKETSNVDAKAISSKGRYVGTDKGCAVFEFGSGNYQLTSNL